MFSGLFGRSHQHHTVVDTERIASIKKELFQHTQFLELPAGQTTLQTTAGDNVPLITQQDIDDFLADLNDFRPDGPWRILFDDSKSDLSLVMWYKEGEVSQRGFKKYKFRVKVPNVSLDTFIACMRDYGTRPLWDEQNVYRAIPEIITFQGNGNQRLVVEHMVKKGFLMVAPRELITMNCERILDDGRVVCFGRGYSVASSSPLPADLHKHVVRAELICSGFLLQTDPVDPSSTIMTQITQLDPNGFLPSSVVNYGTRFLPKSFAEGIIRAAKWRQEAGLQNDDKTYQINVYREDLSKLKQVAVEGQNVK